MRFSSKKELFLEKEIKTLRQKGVIKESQLEEGEFMSPSFLVKNSDDSFRMISKLKRLDENMPCIHFKIETKRYILSSVASNCYMTKVDIMEVYYTVPFLPELQKYLKSYFRGPLYQITCHSNGLCSGPRKFTKLLNPSLFYLSLQQITVATFIDDLTFMSRSFVTCESNIKLIEILPDSLRFLVYPDSSIFSELE